MGPCRTRANVAGIRAGCKRRAGHEGTAWLRWLTNNRFAPRQENSGLVVLHRGAIPTDRVVVQARRKPRVMILADPGCSLLPLTTGNWSITKQGERRWEVGSVNENSALSQAPRRHRPQRRFRPRLYRTASICRLRRARPRRRSKRALMSWPTLTANNSA